MKNIVLLGSTGSIGVQVLDIIRAFPDRLKVVGLAGGKNNKLLARQIEDFKPRWIYIRESVKNDLPPGEHEFMSMEDMVSLPEVDEAVIATEGKVGLLPLLKALRHGKKVALANKEPLVMAGDIVMQTAKASGAVVMPIDSEHSAIWQCLCGEKTGAKRLILTASGGAFRSLPLHELSTVTPEQALNHPTWKMGKKVTVDSASLMNKGLETIEAHWLFSMPFHSIDVVLHPQSIIHSMVEMQDGSIKAQVSLPDMRFPIQFALSYPERWENPSLPLLDLRKNLNLELMPIDLQRYPCLRLALEAGKKGGTAPAVLCGADEIAVQFFLSGKIAFTQIPSMIEKALKSHSFIETPSLQEILQADEWAREFVCRGGAS